MNLSENFVIKFYDFVKQAYDFLASVFSFFFDNTVYSGFSQIVNKLTSIFEGNIIGEAIADAIDVVVNNIIKGTIIGDMNLLLFIFSTAISIALFIGFIKFLII